MNIDYKPRSSARVGELTRAVIADEGGPAHLAIVTSRFGPYSAGAFGDTLCGREGMVLHHALAEIVPGAEPFCEACVNAYEEASDE